MLEIKCEEHLNKVKEFAERTNQTESLQQQLEYLGTYACHKNPDDTKCELYQDFSPWSFYFVMMKKQIDGSYARWFNGGCLYYGPGENGVGFPQLSVRLGDCSKSGWSIHT